MNNQERIASIEDTVNFAKFSPPDSKPRRHLDHMIGSIVITIASLSEILTGTLNLNIKEIGFGTLLFLSSNIHTSIRLKKIEKIMKQQ